MIQHYEDIAILTMKLAGLFWHEQNSTLPTLQNIYYIHELQNKQPIACFYVPAKTITVITTAISAKLQVLSYLSLVIEQWQSLCPSEIYSTKQRSIIWTSSSKYVSWTNCHWDLCKKNPAWTVQCKTTRNSGKLCMTGSMLDKKEIGKCHLLLKRNLCWLSAGHNSNNLYTC